MGDWLEKIKKIVYVALAIRKYWYDPEVRNAVEVLLNKAHELENIIEE